QVGGWAEIAAGRDTLIAAPTGSGKTLAAFLVCIDRLYRAHDQGAPLPEGPQVVYVSPLKALAVDIHQNLDAPLRGIAEAARELGLAAPQIEVAVRTGDTTAPERAAMLRRRRARPLERRRLAPLRRRRRRPPTCPRPGPGAARRRARGGGHQRADGRDPRAHLGARERPPHDAGLREHPADGGAGRPPDGGAA